MGCGMEWDCFELGYRRESKFASVVVFYPERLSTVLYCTQPVRCELYHEKKNKKTTESISLFSLLALLPEGKERE
jgi:hypothetical protein